MTQLTSQGFTRTRASEDWINSAMNYGYAIARAALARGLDDLLQK